MIKASLERFDSPIVMINQVYENEDWGVIANYVSKQDVAETGEETSFVDIGWHVSVTFPNLDDVDFTQVFSTPESALEYGISQILSGNLVPATSVENTKKDVSHPFRKYDSIV